MSELMKISSTTAIISMREKKYVADRKRNKIVIKKHTLKFSFRNVVEEV